MLKPTDPADIVELTLTDGRHIGVRSAIADRVRGIDADGDPLVVLGKADKPIRDEDGEYLIPLTPCCHAGGKGAESGTGVACRRCHQEVDSKYGGRGTLALAVVIRTSGRRSSGLTPLLVRRDLTSHAASNAPWATVEDALSALRDATPPVADLDRQAWLDSISETLSLLCAASDVLLSPARHFLLIHSRTLRNRPLRWYVVHVATGAHLPQLRGPWPAADTSPQGAELDLTRQAIVDYVDAIERLPGRRGGPVDWGVAASDLWAEISHWQDPLAQHDDQVLDSPRRDRHGVATAARPLDRAAVLHALAADPVRDVTTETVQQVVVDLLDEALPPVYDRDPAEPAGYLREFLRQLNGGRRRGRDDTRTPQARQGDIRTATVVTLAALAAFGGRPRAAVRSLREHASQLRREQNWYTTTDRVDRLLHTALLLGELFSPAPTERQLLRQVNAGDVIAFLHVNSTLFDDPVDRVVQVIGPVQYLELGAANGAEQFVVPVNDLTDGRPQPAMLVVTPDKPFSLVMLNERPWSRRLSVPMMALDRWAILPADAAGKEHEALAERARTASRRAAEAFDVADSVTKTPHRPKS